MERKEVEGWDGSLGDVQGDRCGGQRSRRVKLTPASQHCPFAFVRLWLWGKGGGREKRGVTAQWTQAGSVSRDRALGTRNWKVGRTRVKGVKGKRDILVWKLRFLRMNLGSGGPDLAVMTAGGCQSPLLEFEGSL